MGIRNSIFKMLGLAQYLLIFPFLRIKGHTSIKPFLFHSWHHGVCYFSAIQSESKQKVFIKTSGTYDAARTEYHCLTAINSFSENLAPKPYKFYDWKIFSFVITEMLDGSPLTKGNLPEKQFEDFCNRIIPALNYTNIIHRDISPANMIVNKNGILLIDFAWAAYPNCKRDDKKHIDNLSALGGNFKPDTLTWQDSYSLSKTFNYIYSKNINLNQVTDTLRFYY